MSNRKKYFAPIVFGIGIAVFATLFTFERVRIYAQETLALPPGISVANLKTEIASTSDKSSASAKNYAESAAANSAYKNNLKWTFGGKPQVGWSLYVSLIQKEIGSESLPESAEFAARLAQWQTKNNRAPSGILDEETLGDFIKIWQSRRLNSSVYPSDKQLFSAPISEFFDPTRSAELLKVERETYAAYKKMLAAAIADKSLDLKTTKTGELAPDEKFLRIISAFRSREYQEQLRKKEPNAGRAGLAKHSPHFTGRALDLYVGGEPVTTRDDNRAVQVETRVYRWLVKNAHRFGFYPYFYEPWHWEYVGEKK